MSQRLAPCYRMDCKNVALAISQTPLCVGCAGFASSSSRALLWHGHRVEDVRCVVRDRLGRFPLSWDAWTEVSAATTPGTLIVGDGWWLELDDDARHGPRWLFRTKPPETTVPLDSPESRRVWELNHGRGGRYDCDCAACTEARFAYEADSHNRAMRGDV